MKKIVTKIKIEQEINNNLKYWASKPDSEKLSAVQELREQYIKYFNKQTEYNESRKRLRRFYKAFKQI